MALLPTEIIRDIMYKYGGLQHPIAKIIKEELNSPFYPNYVNLYDYKLKYKSNRHKHKQSFYNQKKDYNKHIKNIYTYKTPSHLVAWFVWCYDGGILKHHRTHRQMMGF
jgi:hypothetical protein